MVANRPNKAASTKKVLGCTQTAIMPGYQACILLGSTKTKKGAETEGYFSTMKPAGESFCLSASVPGQSLRASFFSTGSSAVCKHSVQGMQL